MSGEDPFAFDNRHLKVLPTNARTEVGCPPFGPIFALGAAVDYLAGIGIERIAERVLDLNERLTSRLERIKRKRLGLDRDVEHEIVASVWEDEAEAYARQMGFAGATE